MATLTVREAARVLGVKPSKVRRYVSQRKLSAHAAPPSSGRHGPAQMMLDAVEVETLARIRAHRRRAQQDDAGAHEMPNSNTEVMAEQPAIAAPHSPPSAETQPFTADLDALPDAGMDGNSDDDASITARPEAKSALLEGELVDWRGPGMVQSVLAPLIAELRDARDVIRRQAEELGALRATVAELERRAALVANVDVDAPPQGAAAASANGAHVPLHGSQRRVEAALGNGFAGAATMTSARVTAQPLWRRALTYIFRTNL